MYTVIFNTTTRSHNELVVSMESLSQLTNVFEESKQIVWFKVYSFGHIVTPEDFGFGGYGKWKVK